VVLWVFVGFWILALAHALAVRIAFG